MAGPAGRGQVTPADPKMKRSRADATPRNIWLPDLDSNQGPAD